MKTLATCALVFLLSGVLFAQTKSPAGTASGEKSPVKVTAKRVTKKAPPESPELIKLREALENQQQQIQQLHDELVKRDAALQQMQQQVSDLKAASAKTETAVTDNYKQTEAGLTEIKTSVTDLKTQQTTTANALVDSQKKIKELDAPAQLHYKGVTITPGGFLAGNTIIRSKNLNSDVTDSFAAVPFNNTTNANLSEFRFSARHSRFSLRADAKIGSAKVFGYYELDFEGAAPTSNETQSNSFTPRTRLVFANVDLASGWSFLGGQSWSLLTPYRNGLNPLAELVPAEIDANFHAGYFYARQTTFRVTKNFSNKAWLAFAIENPETKYTAAGSIPGVKLYGTQNADNTCSPSSGFVATQCPSTDKAPDLVAKVAFQPGWGHFEIGAFGRFFRDRIATTTGTGASAVTTARNETTMGGGLTFDAVLPIVPKKVDLWIAAIGGRGVGRFGGAGGPDVTLRPDGSLMPILGYIGTIGLEAHASNKLDLYLYGGDEYYKRSYYNTGTAAAPNYIGYGVPFMDVSGCEVEFPSSTQKCNGVNKSNWEISPGFWYDMWKGKEGRVRYGMSYAYVKRTAWSGQMGTTGTFYSPSGNDHIIMTSFRYYLP